MCPNFGILYDSPEHAEDIDRHYRVAHENGQIDAIQCRMCESQGRLHAMPSLRPIVRHFLSQSLPFADCPNASCRHHGLNAFEFFWGVPGERGRPYKKVREHSLKCNACQKGFSLGTALNVTRTPSFDTSIERILHSVGEGRPVTDGRGSGTPVARHYRRLDVSAERLRDYHSYRNAFLLKPGFCGQEQRPAVVQTDIMRLSLARRGKGKSRVRLLDVIVSVIKLKGTHFVLAAHPFFLPRDRCPDGTAQGEDKEGVPRLERRWDGIRTILDDDLPDYDPEKPAPRLPDTGQRGLYMRTPYAEVAHFLVVRRMLALFPRTLHYMDSSQSLFRSALVAMREDVRSGRAQIAVFQCDRDGEADIRDSVSREEELRRAFDEAEEKRRSKVADERGAAAHMDESILRARAWRYGALGADNLGKELWLDFPPDVRKLPVSRTLWLTRRPQDTFEGGKELLLGTTLQAVDSQISQMRDRVDSLKRPKNVAKGRGYKGVNVSADVACGELWAFLLRRNYGRRPGVSKKTHIPGVVMGMTGRSKAPVKLHKIATNFRLGVEQAKETSLWMAP